jgi:GTP pyrophosphokinase
MPAVINSEVHDAFKDEATRRIGWDQQLEAAFEHAAGAVHSDKGKPNGIDVALRVLELGSDREAVVATLLSDPDLRDVLDHKAIEQEFGGKIAQLTQGVNQLNTLKDGSPASIDSPEQAEKLRRLLLAIISDVRVMLIKLCYRVERLRLLKHGDYELRRRIAQETLDMELEDLAFRALEPLVYKRVAKLLEEKRSEREAFIESFTAQLKTLLREQEIDASVQGRVKHIVSIWRKMPACRAG